ncbi:MAG: hypothetical protein HN929_01800 [Chloroflexi bacterium]|nr:hypothetical protein [Chloroflexota bacterium]MBT7080194.1 hypothetical protein [Chloroflexota bacterium]MBT7290140.1 hypothetical protein [Chloroflexota bacterium]
MIKTIKEYLHQLRKELRGSDSAIVQDALSDAEEHLRDAYNNAITIYPSISDADAIMQVIEEYGTPEEVAAGYRDIEVRTSPALAQRVKRYEEKKRSSWPRFFGVWADSGAWGSVIYMILSLATGIAYFTWAVTGLSVSAGLLVLIIGLPLFALFLLSIRGLALIEGRIVEGLLGVRMPNRPAFTDKRQGWWDRFKSIFTDGHTWSSMLYMIMHLPMGIFYFTLIITLIGVSLWGVALPILQVLLNLNEVTGIRVHGILYQLPDWVTFITPVIGFLVFTATMHVAKRIGCWHGSVAKSMLVRRDSQG